MHLITNSLLNWYHLHGRHDLPWQNTHNAYRIWVSEIMLQQTQVKTVIPYYRLFITRFPSVFELANAPIDAVLHVWTGLGYYARARNLHTAARIIVSHHNGTFPANYNHVLSLPGIGRSTAGAILALSTNQRYAILDGNAKRVLSRVYAIQGWNGNKIVETQLWNLAQMNTPDEQTANYTQAIMDFGATLCTRSNPDCSNCPLNRNCLALQLNIVNEVPHGKPTKTKPVKQTTILLIQNDHGEILLQRRPSRGIWGGLWYRIDP